VSRAVLADTGPLYAAVDIDDQYHLRARDELDRLQRERRPVLVAYTTLTEGHGLVLGRLGTAIGNQWLVNLVDTALLVNPEPADYLSAVVRTANYVDQRITLVDAVVATLAGRLGVLVWTYDYHFDVMRVPVWR
jgi:predicted nucleic acid-binding protein